MLTPQQTEMLDALRVIYGPGNAIWRPSNASRWLHCLGSIQLIARTPGATVSVSGYPAKQGTAAHKVAEIALKSGPTPEEMVGRSVIVDETTGEKFYVDDEMGTHITNFLGIIDRYMAVPGTELFSEEKLSLASLSEKERNFLNECRGTGDIILINRTHRWIVIIDLKYGKGIPVSAKAPQLKVYGLLALLRSLDGTPWNAVHTVIYQPRLPEYHKGADETWDDDAGYKHASFDVSYLTSDFLGEVIAAMKGALDDNPPLSPEAKRCYYCPAAVNCPAVRAAGLAIAADPWNQSTGSFKANDDFGPLPEEILIGTIDNPRPVAKNGRMVLPSPHDLDPGEISWILDSEEILGVWLSAVKHRATQILEEGGRIPNYGLNRRSKHRKWKGERPATEEALLKLGLGPAAIYTEPKLKSPAQVEQLLSSKQRQLLKDLYETPTGDLVLVCTRGGKPSIEVEPMLGPIDLTMID